MGCMSSLDVRVFALKFSDQIIVKVFVIYSHERLKADFRDRKFKCGEDDDGFKIKVTMRNFVKYLESNSMNDDSPLYIFDSTFDDDFSAKRILDDYTVSTASVTRRRFFFQSAC
jgi:hypothetical protein